jgi:hypothetical protein
VENRSESKLLCGQALSASDAAHEAANDVSKLGYLGGVKWGYVDFQGLSHSIASVMTRRLTRDLAYTLLRRRACLRILLFKDFPTTFLWATTKLASCWIFQPSCACRFVITSFQIYLSQSLDLCTPLQRACLCVQTDTIGSRTYHTKGHRHCAGKDHKVELLQLQ